MGSRFSIFSGNSGLMVGSINPPLTLNINVHCTSFARKPRDRGKVLMMGRLQGYRQASRSVVLPGNPLTSKHVRKEAFQECISSKL